MLTNTFDRYQAGDSQLHQLDPRVKVSITFLFILSNVLLPDGAWLAFLLSWVFILACTSLSRLGPGYTLKRSFIALPFALAALTAVFAIPGHVVAVFQLGPWRLAATEPGILRFISIVIRSWLSVQAAILLVATTQFPDLMHALHHLRVPAVLATIISFMYRYLFVLSDEAVRLRRARDARSASTPLHKGGGTLPWRARVAGNMAGQLFLRGYERSDRIYNAMLSRGYSGQLLTLQPHRMRTKDWELGGLALSFLLLLQVIGRV